MSAQTYASENDPYFLSTRGVNSVSFNKQDSPPIAFLDKGILYEMNDGVLYFNGVPLSGGSGGDVSGPTSAKDDSVCRFDNTTGKVIQDSNLILKDSESDYSMRLDQYIPGDDENIRFIYSDTDSSNFIIGPSSGTNNILPSGAGDNCGVGNNCLGGFNPISGGDGCNSNTCLGTRSLGSIIGGAQNTGVGCESLIYCQYGIDNCGVGHQSLFSCVNGTGNSALGSKAGLAITSGVDNTCVGLASLQSLTTGSSCVSVGARSLQNDTQGVFSVAVGTSSQNKTTHTGASIPCTSVGGLSLQQNTTGEANNAFGYRCMEGNISGVSGSFNNAYGTVCMLNTTDASFNNVFGNSCLNNAPSAVGNCCFGQGSGSSLTTNDSYNLFLGNGTSGTSGDNRTIRIGASADGLGIGKPNRCFIQGIYDVNTNPAIYRKLVSIDSDGKLYASTYGESIPYANGYFDNFASPYTATITTINTPVNVTPTFTFTGPGSYFANPSAGTIRLQSIGNINLEASYSVSFRLATGTNRNIQLKLYVNGVAQPGTTTTRRAPSTTEYSCCGWSGILSNVPLNGNIVLTVTNLDSGDDVIFTNVNLFCKMLI